jgi:pimeloyl-ACP methyl ester carboxylesterase
MKLKFKQKVAIKIYSTKIRAINLLSTKKAAQSLFSLFCTPYSGKPKRKIPPLFKKAKTLFVTYEGYKINGWQFCPAKSNGQKVLVVHGFDSSAFKSETIIETLYHNGYEVFAFDAMGHGTSDGKTINAKQYAEIINLINHTYGNMYAFVTHSFGGLSACLAIEEFNININKLILIAPATETTRAIDNFFLFLKMPMRLKPEIEKLIVSFSGHNASYFSVARIVERLTIPILWAHDESDFICPIADVLPVQQKQLPHIDFCITQKLGHNFIYRNKEVLNKVIQFLGKQTIL